VIGIGGFALAYVVIFVFVLPAKMVPPTQRPYVPDTPAVLRPIDTGTAPPEVPVEPSPVTDAISQPPAIDTTPIPAPDLVGMSLPDARRVLNSLRLRPIVTRDTSSFQPPNTVLRQSPAADSLVLVGASVTITASYFPPDSTADTMRVRPGAPLPPIRPVPDTQGVVRPALDSPSRRDTFAPPDIQPD
jgi:hypothetical protein